MKEWDFKIFLRTPVVTAPKLSTLPAALEERGLYLPFGCQTNVTDLMGVYNATANQDWLKLLKRLKIVIRSYTLFEIIEEYLTNEVLN